jgi:predicted AlkP superfamily phosphohydrolase/phosphomutase
MIMQDRKPKLILIGLDGAMPDMIDRFLLDLPTFRRFVENGFFAPAWSSPCCDTPTNWTTIATGSWTGTHGITSFVAHLPGTSLASGERTFNSRLCRSEYLWQAAERQGLRSILLNYPTAFPITLKDGIVVGGDGLISTEWTCHSPLCYHSATAAGKRQGLVDLVSATGWMNLPPHHHALEAALCLSGGQRAVWDQAGLQSEDEGSVEGTDSVPDFYALLLDTEGAGFDQVIVSPERDGAQAVAALAVGEASDWVIGPYGKEGEECAFRFRLLELSSDGGTFRLYRTIAGRTTGWAYPAEVAQELVEKVGPFVEGAEFAGGVERNGDELIHLEQMELQTDWMARAAEYLVSNHECDVLLAQLHTTDGPNHQWLAYVTPESSKYDPDRAGFYWDLFKRNYQICDRMIGRIIEGCAGPDTVVAIVSDHGAVHTDRVVWTAGALMRKGLMAYKPTDKPGVFEIDEARSKVRPTNVNYIWVNLKGREEGGIVEPGAEYEEVCNRVIQALYALRDPETGVCPVAVAVRREDAEQFGQYGDRVGDIVYYMKPGYTDYPCGNQTLDLNTYRFVDPIDYVMNGGFAEAKEHNGLHHSHLPYARNSVASNRAIFLAMGPGVRQGARVDHVNLVDVAPTLCHLIGIDPPAQSEGRIVPDALR